MEPRSMAFSSADIDDAIDCAVTKAGLKELKAEQRRVIHAFVSS